MLAAPIDNFEKADLIFCSSHQKEIVRRLDHDVVSSRFMPSTIGLIPQFNTGIDVSTVLSESAIREKSEESLFSINNPEETIHFILNNPELLNVLSTAKAEVEKYFPEAELHLGYYKDIEEGFECLNIQILHKIDFVIAFEKENELFDNWFEKHYIETNGKITLRAYQIA